MKATPRKEIVKKIVVDTAIDEDTINDVLSFAFSKACQAFKTGNSVEISGFGKFVFNMLAAKNLLRIHEKGVIDIERTREKILHLPKYVEYKNVLIFEKNEAIKDIKRRMNDKLETCDGRVEKPPIPSGEAESSD
jgi:nucleoid DNA-binding protein